MLLEGTLEPGSKVVVGAKDGGLDFEVVEAVKTGGGSDE